MKIVIVWVLVVACGENTPPVPTCAEVGCSDSSQIVCRRDGTCVCPQNPGEPAEVCVREPKKF